MHDMGRHRRHLSDAIQVPNNFVCSEFRSVASAIGWRALTFDPGAAAPEEELSSYFFYFAIFSVFFLSSFPDVFEAVLNRARFRPWGRCSSRTISQ